MQNSEIKIIYEDNDLLVADKPAGIVVFNEQRTESKEQKSAKTLIDLIIEERPELKNAGAAPRYGAVHRLDKDTSGIWLAAKNSQALIFFQKQFKNREIEKKYTALVNGVISGNGGQIETLIGRSAKDPRKQKVFLPGEPGSEGKRNALTAYKVIERFKDYTLLEVDIKTGRRHQIRCHLSHIQHPVAGDELYGFKNQAKPEGLNRQFLHASYLKIKMPDEKIKEFKSELPEELNAILKKLEIKN